MRISDIYRENSTVFSCEIFPPRPESELSSIYRTIEEISSVNPHFVSVTYGAGGGTKKRTMQISSDIKNRYSLEPLMHLTCIDSSREDIESLLGQLNDKNINNILALRGDIPEGREKGDTAGDFRYACDLAGFIKKAAGNFCAGVAGYPEGHPESENYEKDIIYLKNKIDAGGEFIITQLFFNNDCFYSYIDRIRAAGIKVPVSAGIMPVFKASMIKKMVMLSGASIPGELDFVIKKYSSNPEDMVKAGVEYARRQIEEIIASGTAEGIHLYTMNYGRLAREILGGLTGTRKSENKLS